MPDESEDIYVPTGPDDLDQESNIHAIRQVQIESREPLQKSKTDTESGLVAPSKPYRPFTAGNLEDPIILNLNCKNVFPELNLEELPPQIKYKLPVSKHYDPEGKLVKQQEIHTKNNLVNLASMQNVLQSEEGAFKKEVCDKNTSSTKAESKEYKHLNLLEEESELRKIKQTALHVIEDSLTKAVSVANQLNYMNKLGISQSEYSQYEEKKDSSKTQKQSMQTEKRTSNVEKVKSETKKVSFEDDYRVNEREISLDEANKREVRVADEIKKFETFDIQMDSQLNAEERKLITLHDIEEAIEAGTVRLRTGMLKTGSDSIKPVKIEKKTLETAKTSVETNVELAKQKAYEIGLQIIPRISNAVQSSHRCSLMLKKFLLQMTKVVITLYRFIPIEKRYNFIKSKELFGDHEYTHKIYIEDEALRRDTFEDGRGEIKKPKLSGAKIAQIEGLKPAELTDRMNIVISEFLRKAGKEEVIHENIFSCKETKASEVRKSKNERTTKDEFMDSTIDSSSREQTFNESQTRDKFKQGASFRENSFGRNQTGDEYLKETYFTDRTFDKSQTEEEFFDDTTFREKPFDNRKVFEKTYETKSQSYEVRDFKEEKRHTEFKTWKCSSTEPSYETESTSSRDATIPLTYIAIVEAHVYTNKNAIFEEQMRRMSESMKQSDKTESGIIYYRCEVSVFYRHFREPSLPPTVVIESIEEIPSEQVFEEEKQVILQTSSTVYEDTAKEFAVQKISEVLEPLLKIKEVRSVNIKQAYPAIETPLKSISEQISVTMEKENTLEEFKILQQQSHIGIERPIESVIEISEVKEEEKGGFVEIFESDEHKPKPIIEPTTTSIAETTEIFIEEEAVGMLDVPLPIVQLPQPVKVKKTVKSVAETSQVIVDEANVEILNVTKAISATPRLTITDNLGSIAETMIAIIAEPQSENLDVLKVTGEKVKVGVDEVIASEVFEILPEEPVYEEVIQIETKRRQSEVFLEKSLLVLPEITLTSVEEPICDELIVTKALFKEAKVDISGNIVAEITEVSLNEKEQDTLVMIKITSKEPEAIKEESVLCLGETEAVLPFEAPAEPFDTNKIIYQQASLIMEESKSIETTTIKVEEPKEKNVNILKLIKKHTQAFIDVNFFAVAETFFILPEEPKISFEVKENLKQQAHVEVIELKTATVTSVHVEEPKQQIVETPKVTDYEPITAMEASLLTVAENTIVLPEGPHHGCLEIPNIETKRPKKTIEGALIVAETIEVSPTSPEGDINLIEMIQKAANIRIEESKAITTSLVHAEEPKEDKLDELQFIEKKPQISVQDTVLTVPTTIKIWPDGPINQNLLTSKPVEEKAVIDIEELKTASVTVVSVEEPKNENIENFTYGKEELESLLEKPILNVAETFTTVPEGPLYDTFESPVITSSKVNIIVEEIKPITVSITTPNEPQEKKVDIPEVKGIKPQPLVEERYLPVVETISVTTEEPKIKTYVVTQTVDEHAKLNIEVCESAETTVITIGEPKEEHFEVPKYVENKPMSMKETFAYTVPEIVEIIPDESKTSFTVPSVVNEHAGVKVTELKGTSTTVIYPEEPNEENFKLQIIEPKQQHPVLEGIHLAAPETSVILSEESSTSFEVKKTTSQQANIAVIEQKAAEATIMVTLEARQEDVIIPKTKKKTPQTILESPVLTAAESYFIVPEEKVDELQESIKPVGQKATIYLEGLKAADSIILFSEGPTPDKLEILKLNKKDSHPKMVEKYFPVAEIIFILSLEPKEEPLNISKHTFISNQAKVVIVETTRYAIANITTATVNVAKEEIVDVSKYTVELAEEREEKNALKVTVDIQDIDLSSASSTISSAPSSPLIQEYVFGVATGHEYRVQSPQETSLNIIQPAKDVYGVASAGTSYTLSFEAAYEEEKEVLHMEEFTDVKKKQFWISDIKTMESVESLEANMQLMNVSSDARKSQSKYISVQDSALGIKSRSQSFDTAADFEISLQTSEQSRAKETQISDVQAAGTFNLKSEASFKTIEDVESQAKVNIKSKSAKAYTAQNIDVFYGLTIENEVEVNGQSMELQSSHDATIAKSIKRKVKKGATEMALKSSETDIKASGYHEESMSLESRNISKGRYAAANLKSSSNSETEYTMEETIESRKVSEGRFASIEGNVELSRVSEAKYLAMEQKFGSSEVSGDIHTEIDTSIGSSSISKAKYSTMGGKIESSNVSEDSFASIEGNSDSTRVSKAKHLAMDRKFGSSEFSGDIHTEIDASLESSRISKDNYIAMEGKLESSADSGDIHTETGSNLISTSVSQGSYAALEASSVSESSYLSKQASQKSKSSRAIEVDARKTMFAGKGLTEVGAKTDGQHKLSLETNLKGSKTHVDTYSLKSPSPEDIPSTPLRDEYIFRLLTPAPEETTFIPRDCSFTPESVHEEPLVIVKGMIPHIDTKIVRVLYSPPLETPPKTPDTPWRKAEPVFTKPGLRGGSETPEYTKPGLRGGSETPEYTKPGLKGGSETPEYTKPGLRGGSETPEYTKPGLRGGSETLEFTKEEILEIGRKSALLASAIDRTIRSIEEYKESVGITNEKDIFENEKEKKDYEEIFIESTKGKLDAETINIAENLKQLDLRNKKSRKNIQLLSRF